MKIVQMSDVHVEQGGKFRPDLLDNVIEETNRIEPDLVAVVGDLTGEGYRKEFEQAREYFDRLECSNVRFIMGNHDARNVGYRYFEELFGNRNTTTTVAAPDGEAKVVALDSTKPDLDEGEVGREFYAWMDSEFRNWDRGPKILLLHHHLLAVPGTGRDSNILRDAGDVMALLREVEVDLVLSGHRHVPYIWSISGVRIIHSGTATTERIRGIGPSYNLIEIGVEDVQVTLKDSRGEEDLALASFARRPGRSTELYMDYDRYVSYDELPL